MSTIMTEGVSTPKRMLVLSGGGGRGAFQCGVLEKLTEEIGWKPEALVGTSIGSMNAAVWALHGTAGVRKMWDEIRTRDMHRFLRLRPWRSLFDRTAWRKTLETYAPEDGLRQLKTPLYIVAMDLRAGHPVVYTNSEHFDKKKEKLYRKVEAIKHDHLLASSAIPYLYPPALIGGGPHWDGAVMYNSPLQPAVHSGASQIMIVLLSPYRDLHKPDAELPSPSRGIVGQVGYLLDLILTATFENDFEQMRKVNQRIKERSAKTDQREIEAALIRPEGWLTPLDIIRYRRDRIEDLRQQGKDATEATWKRIQREGWDSLREM